MQLAILYFHLLHRRHCFAARFFGDLKPRQRVYDRIFRVSIVRKFRKRRRGLLYPIKPKPGLNGGPGLRSTTIYRFRTAEAAVPHGLR